MTLGRKRHDLTGQRSLGGLGLLVGLGPAPDAPDGTLMYWWACTGCGREFTFPRAAIRNRRSCGCTRKKRTVNPDAPSQKLRPRPRGADVMSLVGQGLTQGAIARMLGLSRQRVSQIVKRERREANAQSRSA